MQLKQEQHADIHAALSRITAAWDAGDAAAFADEFTDDASYVIFAGIVSFGRAEIERSHVPVLGTWQKGSRMSMTVLDIRVTGDTAIVVSEGGVGKRARVPHDKVQTFVFVREGDRWRCAAFQNTRKNNLFIRMNRLFDPR